MKEFMIALSCLLIFGAIMGYLSGSIMWAIIISKFLKKDVRNFESKNPGATNSARVLGKKWGAVVLMLDTLKAIVPTLIIWLIYHFTVFEQLWWKEQNEKFNGFFNLNFFIYLPGIFAILGHVFPIFFKFKGGKGIACMGGCFLIISPFVAIVAAIIIILSMIITKYVSLGSILAVIISPFMLLVPGINYFYLIYPNIVDCFKIAIRPYMTQFLFTFACLLLVGFLLVWKHKSNIVAIKNKTERQFKFNNSTWINNIKKDC